MKCAATLLGAALLATALLGAPRLAAAHEIGLSSGDYRRDGAIVQATLTFPRGELATLAPGLAAAAPAGPAAPLAAAPLLAAPLLAAVDVGSAGAACPGAVLTVQDAGADGVAVAARWRCPRAEAAVTLTFARFDALSHGHRHVARVAWAGGEQTVALHAAAPSLTLAPAAPAATAAAAAAAAPALGGFLALGVEHILTGYDHLLFLFGLLLVGGRLRSHLAAVSAFTLAHSLTLAVAALGLWAPDGALVEPAIALSVAWVGVENWRLDHAQGRWRLTFLFGLLHGFGFAGALAEVGLPPDAVPLALLGFNLGVELGQLAVLAVTLPLVLWLVRRPWFARRGVRAASAALVAIALFWFGERVLGG